MTYPSEAAMERPLARTVTPIPTDWRLVRHEDGEITLQAGYFWICGNESGMEWRDRETVDCG